MAVVRFTFKLVESFCQEAIFIGENVMHAIPNVMSEGVVLALNQLCPLVAAEVADLNHSSRHIKLWVRITDGLSELTFDINLLESFELSLSLYAPIHPIRNFRVILRRDLDRPKPLFARAIFLLNDLRKIS